MIVFALLNKNVENGDFCAGCRCVTCRLQVRHVHCAWRIACAAWSLMQIRVDVCGSARISLDRLRLPSGDGPGAAWKCHAAAFGPRPRSLTGRDCVFLSARVLTGVPEDGGPPRAVSETARVSIRDAFDGEQACGSRWVCTSPDGQDVSVPLMVHTHSPTHLSTVSFSNSSLLINSIRCSPGGRRSAADTGMLALISGYRGDAGSDLTTEPSPPLGFVFHPRINALTFPLPRFRSESSSDCCPPSRRPRPPPPAARVHTRRDSYIHFIGPPPPPPHPQLI